MSATPSHLIPQSYKRWSGEDSFDAIVVGSGIGGLGAAALLAKYGNKRVLVLERHYAIGGFTHTFHRPGYEWDVGVHYLGDLQPGGMLRSIFDEVSDGQLAWADMGPVYDRVIIDGETFDFPKGEENLQAALVGRFPDEAAAIERYFELVHRVQSCLSRYFTEKALPPLISMLLGPFLRRPFLRHSDKTLAQVLEGLTQNKRLRAVLRAQCGDYGLPPSEASFAIHAMVASHYFEGAYYPIGGAERIAETIVPVIETAGGKGPVAGRSRRDRRREWPRGRCADGGRRPPPAGARRDQRRRRGQHVRAAAAAGCRSEIRTGTAAQKCAAVRGASVSLYWARGDGGRAGFAQAQHLDLSRRRDRPLLRGGTPRPRCRLPLGVYLVPSAKDPDFTNRCPGRATIDVITFVSYDAFSRWEESHWKKRPADYEQLKERLTTTMLEMLYRHVPQVRGKVDVCELSTPLTTRHFANQPHGEIYGIDHTPSRFRQKWLRPQTPIPGLFLTGQDIATCGVAGALFGGVLTASAVLRRNLLSTIAQSAEAREKLPEADQSPVHEPSPTSTSA